MTRLADKWSVSAVLGAVRLMGIPMLAAAVALAVPHGRSTHVKLPSAESRVTAAHAKPGRALARYARPARHRPTIVGEWEFGNGFFIFYRTTTTFTDKVALQRPSVFCPNVNDQDGQMVLHRRPHSLVYTGTWQWFYTSSCKFAGYGPLTIQVWPAGEKATFVSAPPPGLHGTTNTFTLYRVK
jgi:hypothetical protein